MYACGVISFTKMAPPDFNWSRELIIKVCQYCHRFRRRDAASTLQAALKRHLLTRCDDPRHTARTNTPGEGPVLCYQSCHNHPKRVFCRATRAEYFARILAKQGL